MKAGGYEKFTILHYIVSFPSVVAFLLSIIIFYIVIMIIMMMLMMIIIV